MDSSSKPRPTMAAHSSSSAPDSEAKAKMKEYKNILRSTWSKLLENKEEIGLKIYKSIVFDTTSTPTGNGLSTSIIFENSDLGQSSSRFIDMLDTVISQLDEPEALTRRLEELSKMHSDKYDVRKRHYMDFERGFMKAIKWELGAQRTAQHDRAWRWFWDFMLSKMCPDHDSDFHSDSDSAQDTDHETHGDPHYQLTDRSSSILSDDLPSNITERDMVDINEYYRSLYRLLDDALKSSGFTIPDEIVRILTLSSLNLTRFHPKNCNLDSIAIGSCTESGNQKCTATLISNNDYSHCCCTVMAEHWISDSLDSPLSDYIHSIEVVIESESSNHSAHRSRGSLMEGFEVCIGFTSDVVGHRLRSSNGFGDLEGGFAVRCWDKRLIQNGGKISKYTLKDRGDSVLDDDDFSDRLRHRLHESMKVNDTLTFLVDLKPGHRTIDILLNGVQQNDDLRFSKVPSRVALCVSLWTIGLKVRIADWKLVARDD